MEDEGKSKKHRFDEHRRREAKKFKMMERWSWKVLRTGWNEMAESPAAAQEFKMKSPVQMMQKLIFLILYFLKTHKKHTKLLKRRERLVSPEKNNTLEMFLDAEEDEGGFERERKKQSGGSRPLYK